MEDKKLGRPPLKKGKASWKPASVTDVTEKEDGFRYRWSNKGADNLAKKEAEGWETVSRLSSDKSKPSEDRIQDGKNLSSTYEKHDVILQRIPEELAEGRDEYFNNETQRRTAGLTAHLKKEMKEKGGGATIHGDITISSRKGTQVIE